MLTRCLAWSLLGLAALSFLLLDGYSAAQTGVPGAGQRGQAARGGAAERPVEIAVPFKNAANRRRAAELMEQVAVDMIQLRRIAKQCHWNVVGPRFYPLHKLTDETAEAVEMYTDTIAERAIALGRSVDGRTVTVAEQSRLEAVPDGFLEDAEVIRLMADRLAATSVILQANIEALDDVDLTSQDILTEVKQGIDMYHWQFAAQAKNHGS